MHTTALCSQSRSCIITGRNHHSNAMACVTKFATGFPGYNGNVPFENGYLSEMLLEHGYNTYLLGKWHLLPSTKETGAGPYHRRPATGAASSASTASSAATPASGIPTSSTTTSPIEPPATPEEGYHLTPDLVDKATQFIADAKQVDPEKPFYTHFCTGTSAARTMCRKSGPTSTPECSTTAGPCTASERSPVRRSSASSQPMPSSHDTTPTCPSGIPSILAAGAARAARMMEVFAGFLSHTDHHIGRMLDFLRQIGEFDNTLIMVVSDNGASAEGGVDGTPNEAQFFNNCPPADRGKHQGHRRARRPQALQPLPVGLDLGG